MRSMKVLQDIVDQRDCILISDNDKSILCAISLIQ